MDLHATVDEPPVYLDESAEVVAQCVDEVLLPDEALFYIFSKLAARDPATLVAASLACKNFLFVTSSHPSLWRTAFFSPLAPPDTKKDRAFAAHLESLNTYETLVRARRAKQLFEMSHLSFAKATRVTSEDPFADIEACPQIHILVVVRTLDGAPCLYGSGDAPLYYTVVNGKAVRRFHIDVPNLQPFRPVQDLPDQLFKRSWATGVKFDCYVSFGDGAVKCVTLKRNPRQQTYHDSREFYHDGKTCWQLSQPKGVTCREFCVEASSSPTRINDPIMPEPGWQKSGFFVRPDWSLALSGTCSFERGCIAGRIVRP